MKKLLFLFLIAVASCSAPALEQERKIEGPFLILSTPYNEDGTVNYDNLVKEACFAAEWDTPGVIWPQSNDAIDLLTVEERLAGMQALVNEWKNNPKKTVLTLGVNGVSSLTENDFKKYYQDLIDVIKKESPDSDIILQSIYPVCDYYQYVNSISMEKINRANSWIAQLASDNGIYYLNTITSLVNEKGYLNNDYCNGDGIHISKQGFDVILNYIRTHAID